MNDGLIPYRYAKALYKLAADRNATQIVYEEMKEVSAKFASSADLQKAMANPFIAKADKEKLLEAAAGAKFEENFKSFIKLVLHNRRAEFAWRMALAYEKIYRDLNNISEVEITTASELPDKEMKRLREIVQRAFPKRILEFSHSVNPSLIGGFVIKVDNVSMDASISNELEQLRHQLITGK